MSMKDYLADSAPQYKRIAAKYADQIDRGEFAPGERFLSVPKLMKEEGIARPTAQHVMEELKMLKKIYTVPGSGTYVMPRRRGSLEWPKISA